MIHEFRLSSRGKSGVSCSDDGAFVGAIPILARARKNGKDEWRLRDCRDLSEEMSAQYGLPVDMASKKSGLQVIAKALNDGDLARAQVATVLLGIPDPPQLSKGDSSRQRMIKLVRDLHWSGMLKWDPDEHPRWPAGSADGKGGEFAPKGEGSETDGSQSMEIDATRSYDSQQYAPRRNARIQLADAGMSDAYDDPIAEAARAAAQIRSTSTPIPRFDATTQPNDGDGGSEDREIYADYGNHVGGAQLASTAIPMGSLGITRADPANWENLTRLANGSLELSTGQIITAAALLSAVDQSRERDAVRSAIAKFQLNPSQAADVLAARAYVWSNSFAPMNFSDVPYGGPKLESVSSTIMLLERARPGTLYLALQGDRLSTTYLKMAAQEGLSDAAILESRVRLANAPAALQSRSTVARSRLKLEDNDNMQAHHLVPVNIIARNMPLATLASEAGWETDGLYNLIALPSNPETQERLAADGIILPMQNSAHRLYDTQTQKQIEALESLAGSPLTPIKARSILDTVAKENLRQILSREWHPVLKTS